jgi:hypothetical protein
VGIGEVAGCPVSHPSLATLSPAPLNAMWNAQEVGYLIQKTYDGKAARTGGIESLRNVRSEALAVGPSLRGVGIGEVAGCPVSHPSLATLSPAPLNAMWNAEQDTSSRRRTTVRPPEQVALKACGTYGQRRLLWVRSLPRAERCGNRRSCRLPCVPSVTCDSFSCTAERDQKTYDGKAARTGGIESLRNVRSEALAVGPSKQLTSCVRYPALHEGADITGKGAMVCHEPRRMLR